MNKRFFLPALLCGLIVAILTIGCNNVLLKKENNFSVSFVTPVIDGTSSRVSHSVTGVDWNITAWLELQDGSTLQTQETRAASGVPVSLPFEPVEVGTELKVKVELLGIANGIKYADESDWIVVKAEDNPIDLTPSLVPDTTAPLGSQTNPVTTWADLVTIVSDSTTTNAIYIAGTPDSSGLYTMEATSSITISSNITIIPTNNATILRGSSFTDKLFNVTGTLNLGNSSNSFIITLDGQNSAVEQPLVYSSGTLNMTNSVITRNNNSNNFESPSSLFIYSGTTTLNNVCFSDNTSGLSGAADLYLYQGAQLSLAESFASTEIYFSAAMSTTAYPVIQLNQNLSLQDANKVKITVGSTTPENIQVVNKNGYNGDLNDLFTIVATNDSGNTTYTLNDKGIVEVALLGSQANPLTNWTDLKSTMERDSAPSQIYIAGNMEATETITFISNNSTEIIAVNSATITRSSGFTSGPLFETATELTFTGTVATPITFTGNNVEADSPIILAAADLTMTYCTIRNSVNTSSRQGGGAIRFLNGTLELNNCNFIENKSSFDQGGAINISGQNTSSTMTTCNFTGNMANLGGGAIIINGNITSNTDKTHTLRNSTFTNNSTSSTYGGGVYLYKGFMTIDGVTMSNNIISNGENQDIFLYFESSLTLTGHVSIHGLHYNFASSAYPTLQVISPLDKGSDVSIIMSPSSGVDYPQNLQLFTLEDGIDVFTSVNNFTVTGEDGSQYTLNDYGLINKVN